MSIYLKKNMLNDKNQFYITITKKTLENPMKTLENAFPGQTPETRHPPIKNSLLAAEVSLIAENALRRWERSMHFPASRRAQECDSWLLQHLCSENSSLKMAFPLRRCRKKWRFWSPRWVRVSKKVCSAPSVGLGFLNFCDTSSGFIGVLESEAKDGKR